MLKRFLSLAAGLLLMTSIVYADELNLSTIIQTAYASSSVAEQLDDPNCKIIQILEKMHLHIDESSVMPLYQGSLLQYGTTGSFELKEMTDDGRSHYTADVLDETDQFAGVIEFYLNEDSAGLFAIHEREDFPSDPAKNISLLQPIIEDSSWNFDNLTLQSAFIEGAGYSYVLSDGKKTILVPANIKSHCTEFNLESSAFRSPENTSMIIVDQKLQQYGKQLAKKADEFKEYYDSLPEGENPHTGGAISVQPEKNYTFFLCVPLLCLVLGAIYFIYRKKHSSKTHIK